MDRLIFVETQNLEQVRRMGAASVRAERMVTIPADEYEQMKETIEILADSKAARRILESIDQANAGKTISEKEFVRKFGL